MISEFIHKKLEKAKYKILEDGTYFGEISGIKGIWASSKNLEDCRKELQEVLEDWLILKIASGEKVQGFAIKIDRRQLVRYA